MLTDDEILAICTDEIENAASLEGDLARARETALERYLGEPLGDEKEGRSQIVTREVLDTVEWLLPQLMRVFTDADSPVSFMPVNAEDEDAAEQDTDVVSHLFWEQNEGYLNTYAWFKDALLSKTGILKVYWDDTETESRAEYDGISDEQLAELLFDQSVTREILEYEATDEGHHVVFKVTCPGKVAVEPCPPEEFGVNADMRTPDVSKARVVWHRTLKTPSDLIQMGYERDFVESLPWSDADIDSAVTHARRHLSDERQIGHGHADWSLQTLWYTECYIRLDRDDDGIAELLKVCLASGRDSHDSGATLLDVEEFDHIPFVAITPTMLTHKFYGLSAADLTMDLQNTNTQLVRNLLDNIYLVNNREKAIDDAHVNLDDATVSRAGGVVRVDTHEGRIPIGNVFLPLVHQPLGPDAYNLLEHLSAELKSRTGVGDEVGALDPGKLANINTGVAAIAYDTVRAKIELIARNFAELGFRPLYRKLHELVRKHQDRPLTVKLRNQWVQVNPSDWRERTNMQVNVGMGQASRERRMMALESVLEKQALAAQMGGVPAIVGPQHIHAALSDYTEALGLKQAERYWQDPATYQPPPPQPSVEQQELQLKGMVEQGKLKVAAEKNQIELVKAQSAHQLAQLQAAQKAEEAEVRRQVERMKGELALAKGAQDSQNAQIKLQGEFREKLAEREIKRAELLLEHQQEAHKRAMEQYKAELDASVKLTIAELQGQARAATEQAQAREQESETRTRAASEQLGTLAQTVTRLQRELEAERERREQPVAIDYEPFEDGERIAGIGGRRVVRDSNGRPLRIG